MTVDAADQKDLYEDLDSLADILGHPTSILIRVLETLVDLRTTVLARATVDRWLRDLALPGRPDDLLPVKTMHANMLTGETWYE